jgi:hypothetical protein
MQLMSDTRRRALLGAVVLALILLGLALWQARPADTAVAIPQAPEPPPSPGAIASAPTPSADPAPGAPTEAPAEPEDLPPELAHLPQGVAQCKLSVSIPEASGHLVIGDPSQIPYNGRRVTVSEGTAMLPLVEREGTGVLAIEGYAPVTVSWTESSCSPDPVVLVPGESVLTGHVRNAEGQAEGRVFVEGCGNQALTDKDGMYSMLVQPGTCTVNAFRRDGMLIGKGDAAEVTIADGQEQVLDFVLPELPTAGLGIQFSAQDGGFLIQGVVPGTAAADLGLESGDLVIEVDGTPTEGLSIEDFVDLAVGPVGTEVDIIVVRDGQPERMTLDRREIRRPG